jgi:tetratricopeptide (TPR) repeat protein
MAEVTNTEYTPEELSEIDRIVGLVDRNASAPPMDTGAGESAEGESTGPEEKGPGLDELESFAGKPEDVGLPTSDMDRLADRQPAAGKDAGIEDITHLIREVDDFPQGAGPEEEIEEQEPAAFDRAPEKKEPGPQKSGELTALDELDRLATGEFESPVDQGRTRADTSIGQTRGPRDELSSGGEDIIGPGQSEAVDGMPDLDDISIVERTDIPEARDDEISKIDLSELAQPGPQAPSDDDVLQQQGAAMLSDDDFASISEAADISHEVPSSKPQARDSIGPGGKPAAKTQDADYQEAPELPDLPTFEEAEPVVIEKPRMEARETGGATKGRGEGGAINLSEAEISKLKRNILRYTPVLRDVIKDAVINDLLPLPETRRLVNMVISGGSERDVRGFLEGKLKRQIPAAVGKEAPPRRRVISSRPEYTLAEKERQKRLARTTWIFGLAALSACVAVVIGYQFVYKPWVATSKIREGAAIIRENGDYLKKQKDYAKAEQIFGDVDRNYKKDDVFGYTEYSRAYFDKKEYGYSLAKLNKIYRIQYDKGGPIGIGVLNELGHYYAKVPKEYYDGIRANINKWYYPQSDKKRSEWSSLDVAIEFFRRVLVRDRKDIAALYGIGNAYFYQGQVFKAKQYYQDIVSAQPNSEVGYAGLLNLYISRDVFPAVVDIHAKLTDKNMLDKLPPALLANLASYYLGKKKTATDNVRIDYGVQSSRFKDRDDNIYPAVYTVLEALNKRDEDYPPLHYQFARLSEEQGNLKLMKIHLDKAIDLSLKNYHADYFSALNLMGEYYYRIKEPAKAYEYLNRAIKSSTNPPEFTRDEFYSEPENVGKSYALLGDVFYYFFDKVRMRYGDLEDEHPDEETDKRANYEIAREKYEKALEDGYESPEVHYNLGRIYYLDRLYRKALDQWINLYEDFVARPELMFALGNAFFHMGNYNAAKGEYLKLISAYEYDLDKIRVFDPSNERQARKVSFLSSAYNNLGAVYQEQDNEARSDVSYWKAINYSQRINQDNEYARVNLARSFKKAGEPGEPILDESVPYSIGEYRREAAE